MPSVKLAFELRWVSRCDEAIYQVLKQTHKIVHENLEMFHFGESLPFNTYTTLHKYFTQFKQTKLSNLSTHIILHVGLELEVRFWKAYLTCSLSSTLNHEG